MRRAPAHTLGSSAATGAASAVPLAGTSSLTSRRLRRRASSAKKTHSAHRAAPPREPPMAPPSSAAEGPLSSTGRSTTGGATAATPSGEEAPVQADRSCRKDATAGGWEAPEDVSRATAVAWMLAATACSDASSPAMPPSAASSMGGRVRSRVTFTAEVAGPAEHEPLGAPPSALAGSVEARRVVEVLSATDVSTTELLAMPACWATTARKRVAMVKPLDPMGAVRMEEEEAPAMDSCRDSTTGGGSGPVPGTKEGVTVPDDVAEEEGVTLREPVVEGEGVVE